MARSVFQYQGKAEPVPATPQIGAAELFQYRHMPRLDARRVELSAVAFVPIVTTAAIAPLPFVADLQPMPVKRRDTSAVAFVRQVSVAALTPIPGVFDFMPQPRKRAREEFFVIDPMAYLTPAAPTLSLMRVTRTASGDRVSRMAAGDTITKSGGRA